MGTILEAVQADRVVLQEEVLQEVVLQEVILPEIAHKSLPVMQAKASAR